MQEVRTKGLKSDRAGLYGKISILSKILSKRSKNDLEQGFWTVKGNQVVGFV